jgi:hypothetical protein
MRGRPTFACRRKGENDPMSLALGLLVALTGFHGVVMRAPTTPTCRVGQPCSEPAVGAVLVFSRGDRVAGRSRAGAGGRYTVRLAPGYYTVQTAPVGTIGTGLRPRRVHVVRGVYGRLDFTIDTGIR